jgi:hypothetical protein
MSHAMTLNHLASSNFTSALCNSSGVAMTPSEPSRQTHSQPSPTIPQSGATQIVIELSRSQIDQIIRKASQSGGGASLFTGLYESSTLDISVVARNNPRLSGSLLTGLAVLGLFPRDGSELTNAHIARALNIGVSTAHRYLATLLAAGLVQRDPNTRRYSVPQ